MNLASSASLFTLCFHMEMYPGVYGRVSLPMWMDNSMDAPYTSLGWPTGIRAALKPR